MNQIVIKGRLVRDPELRTVGDGIELCSFAVAVDRPGQSGTADFFDCSAWKKTGAFVAQYFRKGQEILLAGSLVSRKWERDGVRHTAWELSVDRAEFCGPKRDRPAGEPAEEVPPLVPAGSFAVVDDGELPF